MPLGALREALQAAHRRRADGGVEVERRVGAARVQPAQERLPAGGGDAHRTARRRQFLVGRYESQRRLAQHTVARLQGGALPCVDRLHMRIAGLDGTLFEAQDETQPLPRRRGAAVPLRGHLVEQPQPEVDGRHPVPDRSPTGPRPVPARPAPAPRPLPVRTRRRRRATRGSARRAVEPRRRGCRPRSPSAGRGSGVPHCRAAASAAHRAATVRAPPDCPARRPPPPRRARQPPAAAARRHRRPATRGAAQTQTRAAPGTPAAAPPRPPHRQPPRPAARSNRRRPRRPEPPRNRDQLYLGS